MRRTALVLALGLAPLLLAESSRAGAAPICGGNLPLDRTQHVTLDARAYDLAIHPNGNYVVGLSSGVATIDACRLIAIGRCADDDGAYSLRVLGDGSVEYVTREGVVRACDPVTGESRSSSAGAQREHAAVRVEGEQAFLGDRRAPLRGSDGALDSDVSRDGARAAVSLRDGSVLVYSVASAMPIERYRAHSRNAYAVRFDGVRGRIVTVGGEGELGIRRAR